MTRNAKNTTPAKGDAAAPKKKGVGPFQYLSQVRQEARKVTWTTWGELWVSTLLVLILSVIAMLFFWAVDWVISSSIQFILSLGA